MRRSAHEVIKELETRVERLEKQAGTMDFFKTYNRRAQEIVEKINKVLPMGIFASKPEKSRKKSRQAKAIFSGFIGTANSLPVDFDLDRHYKIVFLSDDEYNDPFMYGFKDMYTQGSFTIHIDGRAIATAKNGVMDRDFMRKLLAALR